MWNFRFHGLFGSHFWVFSGSHWNLWLAPFVHLSGMAACYGVWLFDHMFCMWGGGGLTTAAHCNQNLFWCMCLCAAAHAMQHSVVGTVPAQLVIWAAAKVIHMKIWKKQTLFTFVHKHGWHVAALWARKCIWTMSQGGKEMPPSLQWCFWA